jgi:hypothetical protein
VTFIFLSPGVDVEGSAKICKVCGVFFKPEPSSEVEEGFLKRFPRAISVMLRLANLISELKVAIFAAALLSYPCAMLAQRGAGGGHTGGGSAGGGGLSSTGRPTGVDVKDDLKDFHATLAVQATSQQIVLYAAMMKSTEAAIAELKTLLDQIGKNSAAELASRNTAVEQAIERARTENKKFLDGFSEPQKSGLKEITRRLLKADADVAQQAKALDLELRDPKSPGQSIAASAQNLEHTLTNFQHQQLGLGEEMSIVVGSNSQDSAFDLPPVKNLVNFADQPITITTSGVISKGAAEGGQNTFKLDLIADLSDLQRNITDILRTQLDKNDRCGERIRIQDAALSSSEPASQVVLQLHVERWACLGREANEMAEGNATIEVKLASSIGEDGALRLKPEIARVDAQGLIGEWLRSGSLGETVRDAIAESLLSVIRQGEDLKTTLPPAARGNAKLQRAQFQGTGSGKLLAVFDGEIRMSNEQVISFTSELKERHSAPEAVQATVPR